MKGRALITGASAGIGAALAREFARQGHDLILTARDEGRLSALARELRAAHGVDARALPLDLAAADAPQILARKIAALGLAVDILVNNAAIGVHGLFSGSDAGQERRMMRVNQEVPVELCKLFLPGMLARKSGGILNVASTAAFQPGPFMALYHAGKVFLLFFTMALREELRGSGVTVTALCPGPTHSEFQERMGIKDSGAVTWIFMPAEKVARAGYRALAEGRGKAVPGFHNRLGTFLAKLFPWSWGAWVTKRIQGARKRQ